MRRHFNYVSYRTLHGLRKMFDIGMIRAMVAEVEQAKRAAHALALGFRGGRKGETPAYLRKLCTWRAKNA